MADVASHAGVTKQTVSNVLTGNAVVREETRQKVLAAIKELGYRPNLVARGLRKGKTSIVAIVVPAVTMPFYAEIVEEVEHIASAAGYNLLVCTSHASTEQARSQLQILADRSIDGLLLFDDRSISHELVTMVAQRHFPVILCNWEHEPYPEGFAVIGIDYREAGYLSAQYLLGLGYREQIAVIYEAPSHEAHFQGFHDALRKSGVKLETRYTIALDDSTVKGGYQATQRLLDQTPYPRAIYATSDLMAVGSLRALREHGLRVPEDISVLGGADSNLLSELAYPSLTTVALPKREMVEEIMRLLFRCIKEETPSPPLLTLLRPRLVVRASTGPVLP